MKKVCIVLVLIAFPAVAWAQKVDGNSCIACHSEIWDDAQGSIHSQNNILCQNCHGGDSTKADQESAKAPGTNYIGIPDKQQIAEMCGTCHANVETMNAYGIRTDQLARYKTSVHGKKLLLEGDKRVATCSDCHQYHDVLAVKDPNSPVYPTNAPKTCNRCHGNEKLMSSYGLPSDIFAKYSKSVHGHALFDKKDISVANCVSCHGGHGAVPPGVKEIGATCGKCHLNEKKSFLESPHAKLQEQGKFSECISCHGNHDIEHPTPALYEEACLKCHDAKSPAFLQGKQLQGLIRTTQDGLNKTQAIVKQASVEGIFVDPETASLEEAKSNVIAMAPLQHTLSLEKISDLHEKSTSAFKKIDESIQKKRQDLAMRKIALIPVWIFVLVMSWALWIRYKRLKSDHHKGQDE